MPTSTQGHQDEFAGKFSKERVQLPGRCGHRPPTAILGKLPQRAEIPCCILLHLLGIIRL